MPPLQGAAPDVAFLFPANNVRIGEPGERKAQLAAAFSLLRFKRGLHLQAGGLHACARVGLVEAHGALEQLGVHPRSLIVYHEGRGDMFFPKG